jgi:hypothetical protein
MVTPIIAMPWPTTTFVYIEHMLYLLLKNKKQKTKTKHRAKLYMWKLEKMNRMGNPIPTLCNTIIHLEVSSV